MLKERNKHMPKMDGTGPMGAGAMTGRGMGPCGGGMRHGWSGGFMRGMGRSFGFGRRWTTTDEKSALEDEVKILEQELAEAKEDLRSLGNSSKK